MRILDSTKCVDCFKKRKFPKRWNYDLQDNYSAWLTATIYLGLFESILSKNFMFRHLQLKNNKIFSAGFCKNRVLKTFHPLRFAGQQVNFEWAMMASALWKLQKCFSIELSIFYSVSIILIIWFPLLRYNR